MTLFEKLWLSFLFIVNHRFFLSRTSCLPASFQDVMCSLTCHSSFLSPEKEICDIAMWNADDSQQIMLYDVLPGHTTMPLRI